MFAKVLSYIKEKENFEKIIFWFLIIFIIAAGIILRAKVYFYNQSFWLDEMYLGINIVERNYLKLFRALSLSQVAPPFFLLASKFILNICSSDGNIAARDLALRFIPFLSSVFFLPLFAFVSHKIFKNNFLTIAATLLMAFNVSAINYAQEFKQYSTEMLIAIILLYVFYCIDINKDSFKKIAIYSIVFCLAPWFSSTSFFVLLPGFLLIAFNFIKNKYKNIKSFFIIVFSFIVNIILWYFLYYKSVKKALFKYMQTLWGSDFFSGFFTINNFFPLFVQKTQKLLMLINQDAVLVFLAVGAVILIYKKNLKDIFLIFAPIFLCLLASFLKYYPYKQRLILFLVPFYLLLISQCVELFKRKYANLCLFVLVLYFSISGLLAKTETFILHKSQSRMLFERLMADNPKLQNVVFYGPAFRYYSSVSSANVHINEFDSGYRNFEAQDFENKIAKIEANKYIWLFFTYKHDLYNYAENLRSYIMNNKKFKDVKLWKDVETGGYLIRFRK